MIRGIGTVVSPVYGGITANAEFEVLASIIPYQHYLGYLTDAALLAPRPDLSALRIRALHNGIGSNDPRLHQVPFLAASNTRAGEELRQKLEGLPLFYFAPLLTQWLQLGIAGRYFRRQQKACGDSPDVMELPAGPVIQNQLFSMKPI